VTIPGLHPAPPCLLGHTARSTSQQEHRQVNDPNDPNGFPFFLCGISFPVALVRLHRRTGFICRMLSFTCRVFPPPSPLNALAATLPSPVIGQMAVAEMSQRHGVVDLPRFAPPYTRSTCACPWADDMGRSVDFHGKLVMDHFLERILKYGVVPLQHLLWSIWCW
jgi:hypothetical protein